MSEKILGLDIADTSVKAVQISPGLRGCHISGWACAEISVDADPRSVLKDVLAKIAVDGGPCIVSLQTCCASYRNLLMPFRDEKKIAQTIGFELEPMLPFSIDTVTTGYLLSGYSDSETAILAASIPHETLQNCLEALAEYNIDPDVIDLSGVALAVKKSRHDAQPHDALFLDIGSRSTSAIILEKGKIKLVRSFGFGACALKPQDRPKDIPGAEDPRCIVAAFCQELQNTLHSFSCEGQRSFKPEKIFLTGGGALQPDVAPTIEQHLGLPVEMLDLAKQMGIEVPPREGAENWNPLLMDNALAIALREVKAPDSFDFRTGNFSKVKRFEQFKSDVRRASIYIAVIVAAIFSVFITDYRAKQQTYDYIHKEVLKVFHLALPDTKRIVQPVAQLSESIRKIKGSADMPVGPALKTPVAEILRDIMMRFPQDITVEVGSLIFDETHIRLQGDTDAFDTVDVIKRGLEGSTYFSGVSIASARLDKAGEGVVFELNMDLK